MKSIKLYSLIILALLIISCEPNNPETPKDENPKVETDSSLDDEKSNCKVSLNSETSFIKATAISIKDKNGKTVGQGSFFGDYYVPYDGSIVVQYEYYCNYFSSRNGCEKWYPDSFEIAVSSAQSLEVKIVAQDEHYGLHTYFVIYINGAIWKTIEH